MQELPVVALGCLLHDIGKIIQRADSNPMSQSHSKFGSEFAEEAGLLSANKYWQWVIESINYHHWKDIKQGNATLPIAWFAFEADNLASAHDRKQAQNFEDSEGNRIEETEITRKDDWDRYRRLDSIFSRFKTTDKSAKMPVKLPLWFRRKREGDQVREIYPYPESAEKEASAVEDYQILRDRVLKELLTFLKGKDPTSLETVNATIHYLEENLSMVPPDTYTGHTNDVSLFDHLKLTAAIGSCMYSYVGEKHPDWLEKTGKSVPWDRNFRKEKAYLLVKADVSGIQDFIYNISSKAALKGLRGRSFYLELLQVQLCEHLLAKLGLSTANLIYQGGGGFLMLAPNTQRARDVLHDSRREFNDWLFQHFRTRLYLALEYSEVSGEELRGGFAEGGHTLAGAWRDISSKLTAAKSERFRDLLPKVFQPRDFVAECRICYRDDVEVVPLQDEDGAEQLKVCHTCQQLVALGGRLPQAGYRQGGGKLSELIVASNSTATGVIPAWNPEKAVFDSVQARIDVPQPPDKNSFVLHNFDLFRPPKLFWSLRKFKNNEFTDLSGAAQGVERVGILRADVDNLGKVFSGQDPNIGLPTELRSISRDAALSRSLARFFTHYLDDMLTHPKLGSDEPWAITTVYSGGDDLFLVGAWNQILDFALLLQDRFSQFTCGRLTMSAGVSIHKPRYPLYRMAEDAAVAEHTAKKSGKDRLCVYFDERIDLKVPCHCFTWAQWSEQIRPLVGEINHLSSEARISSGFWNFLLNFIRDDDGSFYRLLYNTARMEERNKSLRDDDRWMEFKSKWIIAPGANKDNQEKRRLLETALNWFILHERETSTAEPQTVS